MVIIQHLPLMIHICMKEILLYTWGGWDKSRTQATNFDQYNKGRVYHEAPVLDRQMNQLLLPQTSPILIYAVWYEHIVEAVSSACQVTICRKSKSRNSPLVDTFPAHSFLCRLKMASALAMADCIWLAQLVITVMSLLRFSLFAESTPDNEENFPVSPEDQRHIYSQAKGSFWSQNLDPKKGHCDPLT